MNVTELHPQPQELSVIPVKRRSMEIITRGRHKRIRHKRGRRDKAVLGWAVVSGVQAAINMILLIIIFFMRGG